MIVTGRALLMSVKKGTKKDGDNWFMVRFLDEDRDTFFNIFVDEDCYKKFEKCEKRTQMMIQVNLVPGEKYFDLIDLEEMK